MSDPWEILDKIANVIEVVMFVLGAGYTLHKNRDKLLTWRRNIRGAISDHGLLSDSLTQELTGGGIKSLASLGAGTLVGTAQGRSRASGMLSVSYPKKLSAAEELLWWYLRVR